MCGTRSRHGGPAEALTSRDPEVNEEHVPVPQPRASSWARAATCPISLEAGGQDRPAPVPAFWSEQGQ